MNLRLPVIAGVVGVAATVAAFRGLRPSSPPSPPSAAASSAGDFTIATDAPAAHRGATRPPRATVTVYVAGSVARAGVYAIPATARAIDALRVAGGATRDADLVAVNLAEPVTDGEEIVVPQKGSAAEANTPGASASTGRTTRSHRGRHRKRKKHHARHAAAATADGAATAGAAPRADGAPASDVDPPAHVVDLNTADENELETLPGVGSELAERIVRFRELNGRFASADDLLDVGGMTQGRLDALAPYVSAE